MKKDRVLFVVLGLIWMSAPCADLMARDSNTSVYPFVRESMHNDESAPHWLVWRQNEKAIELRDAPGGRTVIGRISVASQERLPFFKAANVIQEPATGTATENIRTKVRKWGRVPTLSAADYWAFHTSKEVEVQIPRSARIEILEYRPSEEGTECFFRFDGEMMLVNAGMANDGTPLCLGEKMEYAGHPKAEEWFWIKSARGSGWIKKDPSRFKVVYER